MSRIGRDKIIGLVICLLAVTVVVGGIVKSRRPSAAFRPVQTAMVGKPAPDFALRDLDGKEVKLADFRGKVVILDFWATWCPPCVKEIPHFVELYEQYREQDFMMLGISVDNGTGVVKSFVQQHQVNYPILMADGKTQQAYGRIRSIPTTFVIDKEGNIQRQYVGYREKSVFEEDVKTLLAGNSLVQAVPITSTDSLATTPNTPPKDFAQTYPEGVPGEIVNEKDGSRMVLIPAGKFQMGTDSAEVEQLVQMANAEVGESDAPSGFWVWSFGYETPLHTVHLDAFYMDIYEVTNAQYRMFVQATGYHEPKATAFVDSEMREGFQPWKDSRFNSPDQPVVCVSWEDAVAYAEWAGKRLPTEAEWEKAARGGLIGKRYPWGDAAPDGTQCNFADQNTDYLWSDGEANDGYSCTAPVGSFAPNGYGLYDMSGNVYEWCSDWFRIDYYAKSPKRNPRGPNSGVDDRHILRGGAWALPPSYLRSANRGAPAYTHHYYGFRCVQNVKL